MKVYNFIFVVHVLSLSLWLLNLTWTYQIPFKTMLSLTSAVGYWIHIKIEKFLKLIHEEKALFLLLIWMFLHWFEVIQLVSDGTVGSKKNNKSFSVDWKFFLAIQECFVGSLQRLYFLFISCSLKKSSADM